MDNVEMGDPTAKTFTYYQIKRRFGNIYNSSVQQVVDMFHTITLGQHGDLHGNNIVFVKRGNSMDIRIIDYGSWKDDTEPLVFLKTLNNVHIYRLSNGRLFRENKNMLEHIFK